MDFKTALNNVMGLASGSKDPLALQAVLEVQRQLIAIQEENRELREENHKLKNERITEGNLVYKNNAYYKIGDEDKAYCSRCFDADKKLITLTKQIPVLSTTFQFKCPNCNNTFDSEIKHNQDTSIPF